MKRPLVVIATGFVLGEVLTLCLQAAVYKKIFWLFWVLFLAVLTARCFFKRGLNKDQSRSVIYRTVLLFFVLFFGCTILFLLLFKLFFKFSFIFLMLESMFFCEDFELIFSKSLRELSAIFANFED